MASPWTARATPMSPALPPRPISPPRRARMTALAVATARATNTTRSSTMTCTSPNSTRRGTGCSTRPTWAAATRTSSTTASPWTTPEPPTWAATPCPPISPSRRALTTPPAAPMAPATPTPNIQTVTPIVLSPSSTPPAATWSTRPMWGEADGTLCWAWTWTAAVTPTWAATPGPPISPPPPTPIKPPTPAVMRTSWPSNSAPTAADCYTPPFWAAVIWSVGGASPPTTSETSTWWARPTRRISPSRTPTSRRATPALAVSMGSWPGWIPPKAGPIPWSTPPTWAAGA